MWIIETINIDMFIFAVSYDYFVFVHVDAFGSAKISLRPDNEDSKRMKTKRKPKTKRRSKLVVSDSDDIALQLNMINVFQKTSKYRNEPHRLLMHATILEKSNATANIHYRIESQKTFCVFLFS